MINTRSNEDEIAKNANFFMPISLVNPMNQMMNNRLTINGPRCPPMAFNNPIANK
jgi:hypothetical protein